MGDGGERFGGGRGRNQPNRGRGRNVWQRDEAAQTSSNNLRGSNSHSQQSNDRWEAAVWESEKRRQEASSTGGGKAVAAQGAGASSLMAAGDPAPCLHCNIVGHYTARCPTIRCDRCKKLGHIAQICQTVLPWECVPSMCGFQAPGRGFFYMPDQSSSKLIKERATSVVITIIEGSATSREIEQSFNIIFGDSWRCTARAIGPNQYTMRFPTPREVERAVCYGAFMKLKTVDATVNLSPWTASVGAKAPLQKAWVKISNIPLDKRCEANVFYAGGLVGVSLDLDASTLHKPEYVKVLIGCRDIDMIPLSAEGCLGDNFYDFYYEIDKIVVGRLPSDATNVTVGNSGAPSPKRQRVEQSNNVTEETSGSQLVSRWGSPCSFLFPPALKSPLPPRLVEQARWGGRWRRRQVWRRKCAVAEGNAVGRGKASGQRWRCYGVAEASGQRPCAEVIEGGGNTVDAKEMSSGCNEEEQRPWWQERHLWFDVKEIPIPMVTTTNSDALLQLGFPTQSGQIFVVCSPIIYRGYV
ncbi:hypothetical protein ACQ4PT_034685 [Festuca glaucescens]